MAALVIVVAAVVNIAGFTGQVRQRGLIVLALADIFLQLAVIVVGAIVVFHPDLLTSNLDLFTSPSGGDIFEALAIATLAFAGIEAASDLAPDLKWEPRDLRRVVSSTAILLPLTYAAMAAVALMAVPVVPGPDGAQTALGDRFIEEPVLGVVMSYDPAWLSTGLAGGRGGDRARGAGLGGEHLDAGAVSARVRAGHQPPGPELAGQARASARLRTWRSRLPR